MKVENMGLTVAQQQLFELTTLRTMFHAYVIATLDKDQIKKFEEVFNASATIMKEPSE